ncbi:MAG: IS1380 family transposase, partial [Burkholderiales bacterium]|nr:IS1380 family transposase [Burkholderiales bacterium]
ERDRPLASAPTLCRLENRASRAAAWAIHEVIIEKFIASFKTPPRELVLDFDATDDPLYGRQEGRFFHGYYDSYCYLPLYVFCGERLLVAYLRPSNIDESRHAGAVLKLLVARLRQAWPEVRIVLRGDSGFCRRRILAWCERNGVGYVVGLAKNRRLNRMTEVQRERLARQFAQSQAKQREFAELRYAARTWKTERRVIARLEHMDKGDNPRYLVTNVQGDARSVYEDLYCARGEMENRIKEAQLGLFADRTSCQRLLANQFRLLLSALAYILTERLRALALAGTEFARLQASTLRAKLLKIGAVILRNTRRVRVMLSSAFPYQAVYLAAARALDSS